MSFFDPILDVFGDLDDTVNEEIPGGWATVAAVTAAAMGVPMPGGGAETTIPSWDVLPAVGEGITAITPEAIAASTAPMVPAAVPGPMYIPPAPDIGTSGVTSLIQNSPYSSGTQVADLATKGSVTFDATGTPTYTSGTLPSGGPVPSSPYSLTSANPTIPNPTYSLAPTGGASTGVQALNPAAGTAQGITGSANSLYTSPESSGFMKGLGEFGSWAAANPWPTLAGTYLGAAGLGLLGKNEVPAQEKYNGPLSRYSLSPNFQASNAQPNIYKPRYAAAGGIMQAGGPVEQMSMNAVGNNTGYPQSGLPYSGYSSPTASPIPQNVVQGDAGDVGVNPQTGQERFAKGGIAHFRSGREVRGGNLSAAMDFYKNMTESQAQPPSAKGDPGIYYDQDPDTRYQDALTAAQIRQAKVNKRAYVTPPVAKRPTPMGQLNLKPPGAKAAEASSSLDPEMAAQGGIMHSSLGGYAAGGNPRLLKGPGDGMSDNIPATIANKQPARLADGEFVIPADVVSHLGNGSTEAGAKRLHEMMNKVRKARTGNPKQGKQINPNKFMPA